MFYVYIDNIGIIGSDEKCVNAALEETVEILNLQGLLCHETSRASEVSESLGIEFNSKLRCFRSISKRYWKLRRTLEWCLGRENLTGRALEVILGHCTYFALLERSVLSVFASCYKYVKSNYWRSAPIWASVRAELLAFYGLMPMVVCDFSRGWSTSTVMYDSCPEGYGAVVAERSLVDVEALGRCRERSRFKKTSLGPRARALWDLDPDDPLSIRTPPPLADNVGENWVVEGDFPEVPLSFVRDSSWEVTLCDTWKYKMAVHMGEARAAVLSAGQVAMVRSNRGKRHLMIGDNLGVTLALERKRACAYPLLIQIRRLCALSLSTNTFFAWRWVPSEYNPSDIPSRDPFLIPGSLVGIKGTKVDARTEMFKQLGELESVLEAKDARLDLDRTKPVLPSVAKSLPDNEERRVSSQTRKPCFAPAAPRYVEAESGGGQNQSAAHTSCSPSFFVQQQMAKAERAGEVGPGGSRVYRHGLRERRLERGRAESGRQTPAACPPQVRKVLGPGGVWQRIKAFYPGDKERQRSDQRSVPHLLQGVPDVLPQRGSRYQARHWFGSGARPVVHDFVLRRLGGESRRENTCSRDDAPPPFREPRRLEVAEGAQSLGRLAEVGSTASPHAAHSLRGVGPVRLAC